MRLAFAALTIASALPALAQSTRPDFTGTYRLDRAASEGLDQRIAAPRTLKIEHKEPNLKYTGRDGDRSREFTLNTDGSDQVRDEPKGESRINARWEGTALTIRSFRKAEDGSETELVERWSLASDGALTVRQHASVKGARDADGREERESTLVFRRTGR